MRIESKCIFGENKETLVVRVLDDEDIKEIRQRYTAHKCIQIDLSSLQFLDLFECVTILILTGGIPTEEGLQSLYRKETIVSLILDYEETDTDEEGIDLEQFPNLKNVLSRSDLNIKNFHRSDMLRCSVDVLNYYGLSNKPKIRFASNYDLFRGKNFLFCSAEAHTPASIMLMDILAPLNKEFNRKYGNVCFSQNIDQIGIIPICIPQSSINLSYRKERRYVSLKKRMADVRLYISFETFVGGDIVLRRTLCLKNIEESVQYIARKDKSFRHEAFMNAIKDVIYGSNMS